MKRLVSVWLPQWPIERMRRTRPGLVPAPHPGESEPAFALVESGTHGLVLSAVNARARRDGLHIGQRLADALPEEDEGQEPGEGQGQDQPDELDHETPIPSAPRRRRRWHRPGDGRWPR